MARLADARRVAMALEGVVEDKARVGFSVVGRGGKATGFAWVWKERVHPKKARVPNEGVLVVRVASLDDKEALLGVDGEKFFTEPHYDGYAAVLVRLEKVGVKELKAVLTEAWRCAAEPKVKAKVKAKANAKARRVTGASFRKMALAMPGAIEGAHMGHADFRAGKAGKIFATLDAEESKGVVMLSPEQQAALVESAPEAFSPASGAWGRRGCTVVALERAAPAAVEMALEAAWREKAGKRGRG